MNAKTGVSITIAAVSALYLLAPTLTSADTSKDSKATSKQPAQNPAAKPAKPAPQASKIQLIVEANTQTSGDEINEALQEAHGRIVNKTADGELTFYLIEVDKNDYNESFKKLQKNKIFKSVSLNRGYKLQ
jgi:hypothetical protein